MIKPQASMVRQYTQQMHHFTFDRIEPNTEQPDDYVVWASYDGPKMVYQEQSGRIHRLSPGMLKIDSIEEWYALFMIIKDGISAEF